MIEIKSCQQGLFSLYDNNQDLFEGKRFFLIERVSAVSNYYRLWEQANSQSFLLYNVINHEFAAYTFKGNKGLTYKEILDYSIDSKSFLVKINQFPYLVQILFEDGFIHPILYKDVGAEHHLRRPVLRQGNHPNWVFYNMSTKSEQWLRRRGIDNPNYTLGDFLCSKIEKKKYHRIETYCFVVNCSDGTKELRWMDDRDHRLCYPLGIEKRPQKYDFIKEYDNFLVVKYHDIRSVFGLLFKKPKFHNIGSYYSEPLFIEEYRLFVAKGPNNWFVIKDHGSNERPSEIFNHKWKENKFIFVNQYIFNKQREKWFAYDYEGNLVRFNCQILDIVQKGKSISFSIQKDCTQNTCDMNGLLQLKKEYTTDVNSNLTIQFQLSAHRENIKDPSVSGQDRGSLISSSSEIIKNETTANLEEVKPNNADFFACVNDIGDISGRFVRSKKSTRNIKMGQIICWFIQDTNELIFTKLTNTRRHEIIYKSMISFDEARRISTWRSILGKDKCLQGEHKDIVGISDRILGVADSNNNKSLNNSLSDKIARVKSFLINENFSGDIIKRVLSVLFSSSQEGLPIQSHMPSKAKVIFEFKGQHYCLGVNDPWVISDPFYRRKYLNKTSYIAILFDETNHVDNQAGDADYLMLGEGLDRKFNQDFNPTNTCIRDNKKNIYLFKKYDNQIYFYDSVKCIGWNMIPDPLSKGRQLICFKLKSLLLKN